MRASSSSKIALALFCFACSSSESSDGRAEPDAAALDGGSSAHVIGAPCERDEDCGPDRSCLGREASYPGGYCTLACGTNAPCPEESACWSFQPQPGPYWCYALCGGARDPCRNDYRCVRVDPDHEVCAPL